MGLFLPFSALYIANLPRVARGFPLLSQAACQRQTEYAEVAIMLRIKQLDHLVLRVRDLELMMRFYIDALGCSIEKVQENLGLYQLRAGSALIDLIPVSGPLGAKGGAAPGPEGRNLDHFCLQVDPFDPDAIRAHLRQHGADPGEAVSRYGAEGDGPSIYVSDPEGNVVELKGPPWPERRPR